MNVKLWHIGINVSDMEKSLDFYVNVLGFHRAFTFLKNGNKWIEFVEIDHGKYIELFYEKPDVEYSYVNGSFRHLALECDDVYEWAKQIQQRGGILKSGPETGIDGNPQFWICDPDGHQIEVIQVTAGSPQQISLDSNVHQTFDIKV